MKAIGQMFVNTDKRSSISKAVTIEPSGGSLSVYITEAISVPIIFGKKYKHGEG
ncbi:hypothetical protein [Streptococcus halotolerans]|uniref:hypothetical protein n=1 Tax=Streptococcus halotolerans TaxID=1814128 RepID=UPI000B15AE47|nr:hypothetical protein [Streptococcus halotolerans]